MKKTKPKRPRGRPAVRIMPDPIPDTPENVVRAISQGPPKRDWEFMKPGGAGYRVHETVPEYPKRADLSPLVKAHDGSQ